MKKINIMKSGKAHIFEPGLDELMVKNKDRLSYTINYKAAYKDADVIFIAVGTPEKKDGSTNLQYVFGATK